MLNGLILLALTSITSLSTATARAHAWLPCGPNDEDFIHTVDGGMVSKKADVIKGTRVFEGSWVCAGSKISGDAGSVIISGYTVIKDTTLDASKDAFHTDSIGQKKDLNKPSVIQIGCDNSDLSRQRFTAVIGAKISGDVKINCSKITSGGKIPTLHEIESTTPVADRNDKYAINISAVQVRTNMPLTIRDSELSLEGSGYSQINIFSNGEITRAKSTGDLIVKQRSLESPNYIIGQKLSGSTRPLTGGFALGNHAIGEEGSWQPDYMKEKEEAPAAAPVVTPRQQGYQSIEIIQPINQRPEAPANSPYRATMPAR